MEEYKGEIAGGTIKFNAAQTIGQKCVAMLMEPDGAYYEFTKPYCAIGGHPDGYPNGIPNWEFNSLTGKYIDTRIPVEDRKRIWSGEWENMSYKKYLRYVK